MSKFQNIRKDLLNELNTIYSNSFIFEDIKILYHQNILFDLFIKGQGWMSSSKEEVSDILKFNSIAKGDLLITGFGLGMSVLIHSKNPSVDSITVVENNPSMIEGVIPHFKEKSSLEFEVININADNFQSDKKYDSIWVDHFLDMPNKDEVKRWKNEYSKFLNQDGVVGCWGEYD